MCRQSRECSKKTTWLSQIKNGLSQIERISTKKEQEKLDRDTARRSQGKTGIETGENTKDNKCLSYRRNMRSGLKSRSNDLKGSER